MGNRETVNSTTMSHNQPAFVPTSSQSSQIINNLRSHPLAFISPTQSNTRHFHCLKSNTSLVPLWETLVQISDNAPSFPNPAIAPKSSSLLWFRVGHLRLADNPSVTDASFRLEPLLPVLTLSRNQLSHPVLHAVAELRDNLTKLGSTLVIRLVEDSLHHHIAALCEISDFIRPRRILFNQVSAIDQLHLDPLKKRFISLNVRYLNQSTTYLSEPPQHLPPLPPTARNLQFDLSSLNYHPSGEISARSKLIALLQSSSCSIGELGMQMRVELEIGSISKQRMISELDSFSRINRIGHSRSGKPMKRERQPSTFEPFFMGGAQSTPAVVALSIAAYDVNGGDRRGVEWDEKTKSFILKEWEHAETERRMNPQERVQEFIRRRRQFLTRAFFPEDVTPDYYSFTAWRFAQRCVSSTIGVFGTSALLKALGIRSGRIGQAAIISWVLKEGLGRVGKMIWAGSMGKDFDVYPKRWRFRSALLYALGNGLEIVTQIFPASFLVFATAANSMKQVSMLTSSATRNAMYRSFGERSQNIANITAKGEAQIVVADLIGMACGIRLSRIVGSSRLNVLGTYCFLTVLDIFGIYMELRQVVFRSLNAERASIIVHRVLQDGVFLAPSQVSPKESICLKQKHQSWVRLSSIAKAGRNPEELDMLLRVFKRERYLVSTPGSKSGGPCRLVLRNDATNEDVLRAMLLVGHVQREVKNSNKTTLSMEENERILRYAKTLTKRSFSWFVLGLRENGWSTDNLLFGTMKRRGYWRS